MEQRRIWRGRGLTCSARPITASFARSISLIPNGHRLELACNIGTDEQYAELRRVCARNAGGMELKTKKAPRHADWLHTDPEAS